MINFQSCSFQHFAQISIPPHTLLWLIYGKIPCKNFSLIGHECTHSGCTLDHSVFPGNLNRDNQSTLAKWVANNASIVKFSDTVDKFFYLNHAASVKTDNHDPIEDNDNSAEEI